MFRNGSIATLAAIVLFAAPLWAQAQKPKQGQVPKQTFSGPPQVSSARTVEPSSSPLAAARFWDIGYEIAHSEHVTGPEADQAIILLTAAKSLNSQIAGVEPLLLRLASRYAEKDYSEPVIFWLQKYVSESADRVVVADAVRYLLSRLNSPEERKAMLERLAAKIGNKNPAIDSELAASLGLLMLEKANLEPAKYYLVQAYTNNKYNRVAFAKLSELAPSEIGPASHLEHLRLVLRENPLDLNGALAFAGYAERLQLYGLAAPSYQYCAELFRYLYPSEPLPVHIYLPWAVSCYNTEQGLPICLQIAENIRSLKKFDLLLEAIAARAAVKMGKLKEARQICQRAEQKAEELLLLGPGQLQTPGRDGVEPVRPANAKQLAWFYCFADPNADKALDWANRAYNAEPNSPAAGALLAYALSINNQLEYAKPLLAASERSQMADLVQAKIQFAAGNKAEAIQTIKAAVAKDAGSLAAEKGKELLRQLGSEYTPSIDPKTLITFLTDRLGNTLVPQLLPPDKMVDVQFSVRGNDFSYGNELEGIVAIVNKTSEPLIVTENSLFQGNIRVSAAVAGDLKREIPNLASETVRRNLAVLPGKSLVHTLRLSTGELRDLLMTHPQASLEIQFTLYLDPVMTDKGEISNRLVDVKPVTMSLKRPGVKVTGDFVRSRLNAISTGQEAQRIQTAHLFTGLLKEQCVMAEKGTLYPFQYADWLPNQLRLGLTSPSGLLLGGGQGDVGVKVNAMADMLSMPMDQELANAVAKNLNQTQWPARLMAVYLLAKSGESDFGSVLDWAAQNDADELVRSMAVSLRPGSNAATTQRSPAPKPAPAARP